MTGAITRCSSITTALSRTTRPEASAGHFEFDLARDHNAAGASHRNILEQSQTSMTATGPDETPRSGVLSSAAEPMLSRAIAQTLLAPAADRASLFAQLVGEIARFMAAHPEERPWTCAVFRARTALRSFAAVSVTRSSSTRREGSGELEATRTSTRRTCSRTGRARSPR